MRVTLSRIIHHQCDPARTAALAKMIAIKLNVAPRVYVSNGGPLSPSTCGFKIDLSFCPLLPQADISRGHLKMYGHVRYWPKADTRFCTAHVRF
jgi:hypothetical protein